jgi:hypothetical protein
MVDNTPSSFTQPNDFQASIMTENHPNTSPNHLPNPMADNFPNTFSNPLVNTRPIDQSSLLFLHSGDNPRILLIP